MSLLLSLCAPGVRLATGRRRNNELGCSIAVSFFPSHSLLCSPETTLIHQRFHFIVFYNLPPSTATILHIAAMAAKKTAGKKGAINKRKREDESDTSNKRINSMFHTVDKGEYEHRLSQESSQSKATEFSSQQTAPQSSNKAPVRPVTAIDLTQSPSRPASPSMNRLIDIGENFVKKMEHRFRDAYESHRDHYRNIEEASPRLLISGLGVLVVSHLNERGFSTDGIFRAMSIQHNNFKPGVVAKAWEIACDGKVFDLQPSSDSEDDTIYNGGTEWEAWTTDAEVLDLIDAPVETMGLIQMQAVLRWSYRCACRLSTESHFDENFAILIYGMRYLSQSGYVMEETIRAMAMAMLGKREVDIENAWRRAQGVDME